MTMYQVWIKEEFGDTWKLAPCVDLSSVKDQVLEALKHNADYLVTQDMEVTVEVKVTEVPAIPEFPRAPREPKIRRERKKEDKDEAAESGSPEDPGTGGEGNGPV